MTFKQSVHTCLSEKYATFTGVASRSEYWWFYLFTSVVTFIVSAINFPVIRLLVSLAFLLPSLGVAVRRMHDSGHSGWWVICPIVNIVFLFFPTKTYGNKYVS